MKFIIIEQSNGMHFVENVNKALEDGFEIINCSEGLRSDGRHVFVAFLIHKDFPGEWQPPKPETGRSSGRRSRW